MSNRYEKLNHLLAFQQKSHYQHIENPRATIRIDTPSRKAYSLHYKTKTTNEKDRQRKIENKKMLVNLLEIYNGKGLLSRMEESSREVEERRNRSLIKSFKKLEEEKGIRRQNRDLMLNIQNAEPMIGNKKDWNHHFEMHLEREKKLCNYSGRNSTNISGFKTFYQQKRRKLVSEEKGLTERSAESEKEEEEIDNIPEKKHKSKQRRKRRGRKDGKISEHTSIKYSNPQVQT